MICKQCIEGKCKKCMKRNAAKVSSDCTCQHRSYLASLAAEYTNDIRTTVPIDEHNDSRRIRYYKPCNTCQGTGTIQVPFPGKGVTTIIYGD